MPRDEEVGSSGAAAEQSSDLEARESDDLEDDEESDDLVLEESVEGVDSSTEEVGASSGTEEKGDLGEGDELPVGLPGDSLEAFLILILKTKDVSFSIMNILSEYLSQMANTPVPRLRHGGFTLES